MPPSKSQDKVRKDYGKSHHQCAEVRGNQRSTDGALFQGKGKIKNPTTQHPSSLKCKPRRANREVEGKRPFNRSLQEGRTENEKRDKRQRKRRRRHTSHKHTGQNKAKEEKSKAESRDKERTADRLTKEKTIEKEKQREKGEKREVKKEESKLGEVLTMILGILVILESTEVRKGKNRGKQRTKKAREKRRQKRDISEKKYIETTTEEELERIWQEEKHRQAKVADNIRQWKKKGIWKEKRMRKEWRKGKYQRIAIQETKKARIARGRWEEKLLQRTRRERERENNRRGEEVDGRLAILMLTMIAGTVRQQRHTESQHRENKECI